jgi:hypothetical protein
VGAQGEAAGDAELVEPAGPAAVGGGFGEGRGVGDGVVDEDAE